jgi:phosphohistidine phosphatase
MIAAMAAERNSILLYLVRHGAAHTQGEDRDRTLTDTGHDEIDVIARWAAGAGVEPRQIRHSGKRRAEQTASILQDRLAAEDGVVAADGLGPNDDVGIVAESLQKELRSLMLVGHLPSVSRLTSFLLLQDAARDLIDFPTGAMACLARTGEDWRLSWLVTPALARH